MSPAGEPLLRVEDLRVEFPTGDGVVKAVDGISYEVRRGRTLGVVGGQTLEITHSGAKVSIDVTLAELTDAHSALAELF